jgi:hypothetical protein
MKQFSCATKPFSAFLQTSGNRGWLSSHQRDGGQRRQANTGDSQMRTISFLVAFGFVLASPSLAGSSDKGLPGIGTFAYNGSPISASSTVAIVVAAR